MKGWERGGKAESEKRREERRKEREKGEKWRVV